MQGAVYLYSLAPPELIASIQMLRPLGIKVLSLCIQTDSLLSLNEFDLGLSFGNLMYSNIYIVILGSNWSMWLWKCLATAVLLLCLMSKM